MNYLKIYNDIIANAINQNRSKSDKIYYEKHHIVPKCLNGSNSKDNLVFLTAKEHFLCHKLLCEIYPKEPKLLFAFWAMCNQTKGTKNKRDYIVSSKFYSITRQKYATLNSERQLGKIGPMKGIKRSPEVGLKISQTKKTNNITRVQTQQIKDKISQTKLLNPLKNSKFKGYYITPLGKFYSANQASILHQVDSFTIIKRCCSDNNKILSISGVKRAKGLTLDYIGKTFKQMGWGFEPQSRL